MSIHRSVRRAEQTKELDRKAWADLDAIGFEFVVTGNGEAIAGPFYFGRAFDAPPMFSFSASLIDGSSDTAPQITIGVAEWLLDEQEMFVGANLWVVVSGNCFDPGPVHGLVRDDDFEDLLAVQGGGPEGDEIPYMAMARFMSQGDPAPDTQESYSSLFWPSTWPATFPSQIPFRSMQTGLTRPFRWLQMHFDNTFRDAPEGEAKPVQVWRVADNMSRISGQHSLYCDELIPPAHAVPFIQSGSARAVPANILACITYPVVIDEDGFPVGDGHREHLWGWRCEPGTNVKISGYRRHSWGGNAVLGGDAGMTVNVSFWGEDGRISEVDFSSEPIVLVYDSQKLFDLKPAANQWHYFEFSKEQPVGADNPPTNNPGPVAPPGTRYVRIEVAVFQFWLDRVFHATPIPPFETWVDDFRVELVGPQVERRQPEFDVAIKFGGRLLKGYAGVHPLRSYEAPDRVVLS